MPGRGMQDDGSVIFEWHAEGGGEGGVLMLVHWIGTLHFLFFEGLDV